MLMADDNSRDWLFDDVDDDDGNMYIDIQSIWEILEESPDPLKSNLENLSQETVQQDDSVVGITNNCSQSQTELERPASLWFEPAQSVPLPPLQNSEALYFQKQIPEGYNSTVASNIPNGYAMHSFPVDDSNYASDFRVNMQQNYLKEETIFQDRHLEGDGFSQYKNQYLFEVDSSDDAKYKLIEDGVKDSVPPEDFSTSVEYGSFNHQAVWPHENADLELFRDNAFSNYAILPEVSVGDSRGFSQVPLVSSANANIVDAKLKCEEFRFPASGSENLSGVFSGRFPNGSFQTFPSTLPKISSNAQATSMNIMHGNVSRYLASKMLPGVLTCCSNKKDMIQMAGDKQDTLLYPESGIHSLDTDRTHTRHRLIADGCSVDATALEKSSLLTSIFRKHTHTKDENNRFNIQPWCNVTPFSGLGCQKIQNDKLNNSSHFDNESDLCIIEDDVETSYSTMSSVNRMSLIVPQASISGEPFNHSGTGSVRLKTNDEQLVFRAALQDLLQPKSEATPPDGLLAVPLLRHQRIALSWMVQKETAGSHCSGGILADDQGLGKTVSTIALILKERSPSSSLQPNNLMHGQVETLDLDDDDDDCVTEVHGLKQDKQSSQLTPNGNGQSEKIIVGRPAAGTLIVCPTSVLRQWADELNNKVTSKANLSVLVYHGSNRTKDPIELAKYDIVLTTYSIVSMEVPKKPIADEDDEETGKGDNFSSGMKRKYPSNSRKKYSKHKKEIETAFLESAARPLARVRWFRVVLDEAQSIKNHRTQVARACWGLRAKRRWCLSGTPIQNSIDDIYSYFRFLRYEPYAVYKSFCSTIKVPITKNPINGYKKLQAVLKTIMLRRTKGTFLDGEPIITLPPKSVQLTKVEFTKEEREFYSRLEADSRAQFEEYAAAGTVKKNYVNILLLLLRLRQACNHPLLVKENCNSSSLWRPSMEMAKKLPCEKQISLLNSFEASAICGICNDVPEDDVVTECGHVFCNQCISEHLMNDVNQCPNTDCKSKVSANSVFTRAALQSCISKLPQENNELDCNGSKSTEQFEPNSWSELSGSSKIRTAVALLESISNPPKNNDPETDDHSSNRKPGEKAIVFSQWTRMLDLMESSLKSSSINYRRLDGTMSVHARDKAVKDFNTLPEVSVIIMSLKAASLGLNMVAACHVVLLDLWWNPTTEDQAIDRAHRIGQTRPVTVSRLTVKDTVEDRILGLQQKKRKMVASAFGEDEKGSRQSRLTEDDLKYLFMS
ncbi:helicase-like transcription factor CHR28 [Impatiens glandulifera]|uniref:helicase-like transcription factor CHR28 n=1 Tax=Impatiens glandulifera TaxID=253017 RepID=UPI001FB0ABEB|nr:helicase-like transcription factor CHR28 [Impatiens glandulifera]